MPSSEAIRRISPIFTSAFILGLAFSLGCQRAATPPNIFLISFDTLCADHLGYQGYARKTSPHLDAFAADAWNFSDAVTPIPKTGPSFVTILTGLGPSDHGVDHNPLMIPADIPVLTEQLAAAGYQTGAFLANPVLDEQRGYARGFSHYVLDVEPNAAPRQSRAFLDWLATLDPKRPVFAWIHYMDPHGPYLPPAPYAQTFDDDAIFRADTRRVPLTGERIPGFPASSVLGAIPDYQRLGDEDRAAVYVAAYDAEILTSDAAFGELVAALRERGFYDTSVMLVLADHGESLGEHDYWFEHGWFAFDDVLRIPLLLKAPGAAPRSRVVAGSVSTLDVAPTLLELARLPSAQPLPGRDLLRAEVGSEGVVVTNASGYPERYVGLRTPEWKYLRRMRLGGPPVAARGAEELYDLRADPAEAHDLAAAQPERLAAMRDELDRRLARVTARVAPHAPPMSQEMRDRLRSLGYVE